MENKTEYIATPITWTKKVSTKSMVTVPEEVMTIEDIRPGDIITIGLIRIDRMNRTEKTTEIKGCDNNGFQ